MALAAVGTIGTGGVNTAGGSCVITTSAAAEAGNLVVIIMAKDNVATADGTTSEITGITDSGTGISWLSAARYCNGQGAANAGVYVDIWYSVLTNTIALGGTITIAKSTDVDCAASAFEYTKGAGTTISVAGTATEATDAAQVGSMTIGSLSNIERLYVRASAFEDETVADWTPTASPAYTNIPDRGSSTSGAADTNVVIRGEFRIATATGDTSNPASGGSTFDTASAFAAFEEVAGGSVFQSYFYQSLVAGGGSV